MGISDLNPDAHRRRPWNAGNIVGARTIRNRATVIQQKTGTPVQFELMTEARKTLLTWLERRGGSIEGYIISSRVNYMGNLSKRQYARLVDEWVTVVNFDARILDSLDATNQGFTDLQSHRQPAGCSNPAWALEC